MCYSQIVKFLGRSGNNILQLVNCLYFAFEIKNCNKVVFPQQELLSVTKIVNKKESVCQCERRLTDGQNFFFTHNLKFKLSVEEMKRTAELYLVPHLKNVNLIKTETDPEHILIHIRSGDIFKKRPHTHYFPPPLSYYKELIEGYKNCTIVYENEANPSIKILKQQYPDITYQSSSLFQDLETLCRASHLAIGYGSFGLLVYLLSPNITTLYLPSYFVKDTFLYQFKWEEVKELDLISVDLDEYRNKMGNKWAGTTSQVHLMLNYQLATPLFQHRFRQAVIGSQMASNQPVNKGVKREVNKAVFSTRQLISRRRQLSTPPRVIVSNDVNNVNDINNDNVDSRPRNTTNSSLETVIHYCCNRYPESFGGVPRYDYHVSLAFPNRIFVRAGNIKGLNQMIEKYQSRNLVVITDNHLAVDVPNQVPTVIVHHGVVKANMERNPELSKNSFYQRILRDQKRMLEIRDPNTTLILSCSQYCLDLFEEYYGDLYTRFERQLLLHSSELDSSNYKTSLNVDHPVILGNFANNNKGSAILTRLKELLPEFKITTLRTSPTKDIKAHNEEVSNIYLQADIFLQLSGSEGFGYATLDAFNKNLLVCGTDVGLLYDIKDRDVGQIFSYQKRDDPVFVAEQIRELWRKRDSYFGKTKKWYDNHVDFNKWQNNLQTIVENFVKNKKTNKIEINL